MLQLFATNPRRGTAVKQNLRDVPLVRLCGAKSSGSDPETGTADAQGFELSVGCGDGRRMPDFEPRAGQRVLCCRNVNIGGFVLWLAPQG